MKWIYSKLGLQKELNYELPMSNEMFKHRVGTILDAPIVSNKEWHNPQTKNLEFCGNIDDTVFEIYPNKFSTKRSYKNGRIPALGFFEQVNDKLKLKVEIDVFRSLSTSILSMILSAMTTMMLLGCSIFIIQDFEWSLYGLMVTIATIATILFALILMNVFPYLYLRGKVDSLVDEVDRLIEAIDPSKNKNILIRETTIQIGLTDTYEILLPITSEQFHSKFKKQIEIASLDPFTDLFEFIYPPNKLLKGEISPNEIKVRHIKNIWDLNPFYALATITTEQQENETLLKVSISGYSWMLWFALGVSVISSILTFLWLHPSTLILVALSLVVTSILIRVNIDKLIKDLVKELETVL